MKLVIAEKPSVARDIANALGATTKKDGYLEGNGYLVGWARGHLVQLEDPKAYNEDWKVWNKSSLPMIPMEFRLKVTKDSSSVYNTLKELITKKADEIIIATDAGREGELIFRYIYTKVGKKLPLKRLYISSFTEKAIKRGFDNLEEASKYDNLYLSAKARSEADWLVGLNATRATTLVNRTNTVLSVGRVQTPTLAIICQRYLENKNFVSKPYFILKAKLFKEQEFEVRCKEQFDIKATAQTYLEPRREHAICKDYQVKEKKEAPKKLYDLTLLQREANKLYGMKANQTLEATQELYEKHKLVTYPRTDSNYLSEDIYEELPQHFQALKGLPEYAGFVEIILNDISKRNVNNDKVSDHHAIIPTEEDQSKGEQLTGSVGKIWKLIVTRFLEAHLPHCEKEVRTAHFEIGGKEFSASSSQIMIAGWREVKGTAEDEVEESEKEAKFIPVLSPGEKVKVVDTSIEEKKTKPKGLHNHDTLLQMMQTAGKSVDNEELADALKEKGLGTPATRGAIIETLYKRQFVEDEKKKIIPTDLGLKMYQGIKDFQIANAEITGEWEYELSKVEKGELDYDDFMQKIKIYTADLTDRLLKMKPFAQPETFKCPACKKMLQEYKQGYGHKECNVMLWKEKSGYKLKKEDFKALVEGGKTEKRNFKTKEGKPFAAPMMLDEENRVVFDMEKSKETDIQCPCCEMNLFKSPQDWSSQYNCKKCKFTLYKVVAGTTLNQTAIDQLLKGGQTEVLDFVSKKKKRFKAKLKVDKDKKEIEMIFSN